MKMTSLQWKSTRELKVDTIKEAEAVAYLERLSTFHLDKDEFRLFDGKFRKVNP